MNMMLKNTLALACSASLLTACAIDDPNQRAKIGAGVGAVAGAVLGHQAQDRNGRYVGAAAGAAAGAAIGNYMDKQQQAMDRQLAQEQQNQQIELERVQEDTIKLNLSSEVSFDTNSASLKTAFYPSLDKVASVISEYDQTSVRIIGHTDSRGTEEHNQALSLKRAESVSGYLARKGVGYQRISVEGRGEGSPRADNESEGGRAANRRVEILLKSNQPSS